MSGQRFSHCRGCGIRLYTMGDVCDGLCSEDFTTHIAPSCYRRWFNWAMTTPEHRKIAESGTYSAPEVIASIDTWLEKGMP